MRPMSMLDAKSVSVAWIFILHVPAAELVSNLTAWIVPVFVISVGPKATPSTNTFRCGAVPPTGNLEAQGAAISVLVTEAIITLSMALVLRHRGYLLFSYRKAARED
jgi:hypothetical protein